MIVNQVTVIHTENIWGGFQAGILIDSVGEQYRFLSDQSPIPEGRVLVDCEVLSGERMLWISQIYRTQR